MGTVCDHEDSSLLKQHLGPPEGNSSRRTKQLSIMDLLSSWKSSWNPYISEADGPTASHSSRRKSALSPLVQTVHNAHIHLMSHCNVCALAKMASLVFLLSFRHKQMPALTGADLVLVGKSDFLLLMCCLKTREFTQQIYGYGSSVHRHWTLFCPPWCLWSVWICFLWPLHLFTLIGSSVWRDQRPRRPFQRRSAATCVTVPRAVN